MNNLHRELAPISDEAWAQIEEEASRTLKRYLAARRVVDLQGPAGAMLSAVGTGHTRTISGPGDSVLTRQREVKALVEVRVPFELDRQQIDDVERGADDFDWQPLKDAARKMAFTEDRAIFEGYPAADITGIRQGTSNPVMTLPAVVRGYPDAIAQALSQLRLSRRQWPLFGLARCRRLYQARRVKRQWLSHPTACPTFDRNGDRLGSCHRRCCCPNNAWRRFRSPHWTGHFDWIFEPFELNRSALSAGNFHIPATYDRSLGDTDSRHSELKIGAVAERTRWGRSCCWHSTVRRSLIGHGEKTHGKQRFPQQTSREGLTNVGDKIVRMLDPDRYANQ